VGGRREKTSGGPEKRVLKLGRGVRKRYLGKRSGPLGKGEGGEAAHAKSGRTCR